jgi:HAMP domain-containing protein
VARELAAITRCEVNLIAGPTVAATSLTGAARQQLGALVRDEEFMAASTPAVRDVGPGAYVAATYPLSVSGDAAEGQLVLLQDWQPTQQSLREVGLQMTFGALVIFAAALAAALVFSGRVTEALADISRAASETAAGDWTRLVPERGSAEVQNLARAVNAMATSLHRHHAEVEAQRLRVFRATMTTVHDLVNNFLANMQLIRLEAEDRLPQETLDLFDQLIEDNAAELRLLGDLEVVREKEMAVGTGIEYRTASDITGDGTLPADIPAA